MYFARIHTAAGLYHCEMRIAMVWLAAKMCTRRRFDLVTAEALSAVEKRLFELSAAAAQMLGI